jgi:hypothetical protein
MALTQLCKYFPTVISNIIDNYNCIVLIKFNKFKISENLKNKRLMLVILEALNGNINGNIIYKINKKIIVNQTDLFYYPYYKINDTYIKKYMKIVNKSEICDFKNKILYNVENKSLIYLRDNQTSEFYKYDKTLQNIIDMCLIKKDNVKQMYNIFTLHSNMEILCYYQQSEEYDILLDNNIFGGPLIMVKPINQECLIFTNYELGNTYTIDNYMKENIYII